MDRQLGLRWGDAVNVHLPQDLPSVFRASSQRCKSREVCSRRTALEAGRQQCFARNAEKFHGNRLGFERFRLALPKLRNKWKKDKPCSIRCDVGAEVLESGELVNDIGYEVCVVGFDAGREVTESERRSGGGRLILDLARFRYLRGRIKIDVVDRSDQEIGDHFSCAVGFVPSRGEQSTRLGSVLVQDVYETKRERWDGSLQNQVDDAAANGCQGSP